MLCPSIGELSCFTLAFNAWCVLQVLGPFDLCLPSFEIFLSQHSCTPIPYTHEEKKERRPYGQSSPRLDYGGYHGLWCARNYEPLCFLVIVWLKKLEFIYLRAFSAVSSKRTLNPKSHLSH